MSVAVPDTMTGAPAGDFVRSRGAPRVTDPTNPKKMVTYGRPSGFGAPLDNSTNLVRWKERQVVTGLASLRPDWAAVDTDDSGAVDRLVAEAHRAAGSSIAADRGTHIHTLTEVADRGGDIAAHLAAGEVLGLSADVQRSIVAAWQDARRALGVSAVAVELPVVHDAWRLAGTLDRLDVVARPIDTPYGLLPAGCTIIADIKTGRMYTDRDGTPRYWSKYPVQLAAYAGAVPYDVAAGVRGDWPHATPDQRVAIIWHMDAAAAAAGDDWQWQAIPVDLAAGRAGAEVVLAAKAWTPAYGQPITSATSVPADDPRPVDGHTAPNPTDPDSLRERLRALVAAGHAAVIQLAWPDGVPGLREGGHSPDDLARILDAVRRAEDAVGAPWHADDRTPPPPPSADSDQQQQPVSPLDEGDDMTAGEYERLMAMVQALPDAAQAALKQIAREAHDAGMSLSVTQRRSMRRGRIVEALVAWAASGTTPDDLYAQVVQLLDARYTGDVNLTLGAAMASLTIDQALSLAATYTGRPAGG